MSYGSCNLTADEALERLRQGNARYLNVSHAQGDVSPELRQSTFREGQHPYAIVLACSDSRVIPEAIFSAGIGELCGASQREERYDVLLNRIRELGLNEEDYWWYLDLRCFGGNKHAGFGLGFERMVMYLTGISNIRDVLPFPRTTGSAEF